ncbi:MAG TPA: hypothetical protein V6D10_14425 [Trichocoleus sp.]|jgi:hypothetical protein
MEFWEFLLQKDGDRSWLPLESTSVEVLEGRYRVVARASRANLPVEIRITHAAISQNVPVRRVQQRSSRTNRDGLVVILPFTQLEPGDWELRCTGDVMAEMLGDGWEYAVQLQILPIESENSDEWEPEWQLGEQVTAASAINSEVAVSQARDLAGVQAIGTMLTAPLNSPDILSKDAPLTETPPAQEPIELQQAAEQSEQVVAAIFQEPVFQDLDSIAPSASDQSEPVNRTEALPKLRLRLDRETYIVQQGQPLLLSGQIESEDDRSDAALSLVQNLRICLYNPQNAELLFDRSYQLTDTPPCPFTCMLQLPKHYQTYLILGELLLQGAAEPNQEAPVLATQSFNVTTDLRELLESIANDFTADVPPPLEATRFAEPATPATLNLAFFNLPSIPLPEIQFQPAATQPLPPQLRSTSDTPQSKGNSSEQRSLKLPQFDRPVAAPTSAAEPSESPVVSADRPNSESQDEAGNEPIADPETLLMFSEESLDVGVAVRDEALPLVEKMTAEPDRSRPATPALPPQAMLSEPVDPDADWEFAEQPSAHWRQQFTKQTNPQDDRAFRSLNLQQRFWSRLQSLATDKSFSAPANLAANEATSSLEIPASPAESTKPNYRSLRPIGQDAALVEQEFVVDDDWEQTPPRQKQAPSVAALSAQIPPGMAFPADEPLPIPTLEVAAAELIAGRTVSVTVKLPDLMPKLWVKLWLADRQNRTLLDGPRWLMDFLPDGFNYLVAATELVIPYGCLEVQIEAIVVEMTTQRESDKVTVARTVVPPQLSTASLDDLDF